MSGEPLGSAVVLGFLLGLQHATDPDHLVAVATIASRERRFRDGAVVGALWGLGHTATLALAGVLIVALGVGVPATAGVVFELAVALAIVALGALRLRDAFRGADRVAPAHRLADHDHGGREAFHSHPHLHDGRLHSHPHVHPSRPLLAALEAGRGGLVVRAVAVGALHGLAGSAALTLLVLATLRSAGGVAAYLAVFGAGTLIGMTLLTAAMAYPLSLALRVPRAYRAVSGVAGVGAISFGIVHAARLI